MSDNPLESSTLARLGQTEKAEPYVYTCRNGKGKVTFPDPGEMDWIEAEEFMRVFAEEPDSVALREWLSEADYKKILGEKWTLNEKLLVLKDAMAHYSEIFGTPGEGPASAS